LLDYSEAMGREVDAAERIRRSIEEFGLDESGLRHCLTDARKILKRKVRLADR
jgi:hypothetical protein